jgi:phage gp46-like protein
MPKARVDLPLSPAWKYVLMAGTFAPARIPGWTDVVQENGRGNRLWTVHRAALLTEAADNAFEP